MLTDLSLLETAINYLQNKYNIFRRLFKTCTTVWNIKV